MLSSSVDHSQTFSNSFFLKFACGFLLTIGKKTVPAIAKNMGITTSKAYRIIKNQIFHSLSAPKDLFKYIQPFSHEGYIIIDDTVISKHFSKEIQGTSEVFDTIYNRPCIGFSLVTIAWMELKLFLWVLSSGTTKMLLKKCIKLKYSLLKGLFKPSL